MAEQIKDGAGSGSLWRIGSDNRAGVRAVTESAERYENEQGRAYHLLFTATPTAAGDCFLYLKNSSDNDIVMEGIWFRVASAEQVQVKLGDTGTATSGTDVTPVNCNAGSAATAEGTFQTGNDITGLSGGSTVEHYYLTNTASAHHNFEQDIIIPKNSTFTLYVVTGAVAIAGTLVFNYYVETY